jgi:hypothetical protein
MAQQHYPLFSAAVDYLGRHRLLGFIRLGPLKQVSEALVLVYGWQKK